MASFCIYLCIFSWLFLSLVVSSSATDRLYLSSSKWPTVWVKKCPPPEVFWHFPKRLGIFGPNFTRLLHIPVYARLPIIFIQSHPTVTKLWWHIKCDHPACVSADGDSQFTVDVRCSYICIDPTRLVGKQVVHDVCISWSWKYDVMSKIPLHPPIDTYFAYGLKRRSH